MKKILLIDDDRKYATVIKKLLEKNYYIVEYIDNSHEGIARAKEMQFDLIIIDLYLDTFEGLQVAEIIKIYDYLANIIIISNSTDLNDELRTLKSRSGVDYISKTLEIEVFLERIKKALSKPKAQEKTKSNIIEVKHEKMTIDTYKREVVINRVVMDLTKTEFDILIELINNSNKVLSREYLIEVVWKTPFDQLIIDTRSIDTHIKNIKKKLKINSIISVRGVGYRWYYDED